MNPELYIELYMNVVYIRLVVIDDVNWYRGGFVRSIFLFCNSFYNYIFGLKIESPASVPIRSRVTESTGVTENCVPRIRLETVEVENLSLSGDSAAIKVVKTYDVLRPPRQLFPNILQCITKW